MKKEQLFLIISGILYGTVTVGGQFFVNRGLSLFEIAFYRPLLAAMVLLPLILLKRKYLFGGSNILFFVLYGLVGALAGLSQNLGLVLGVPVAMVVFLIYTQPVWTILLGRLMLNEPISVRKIISACLAITGALVLLSVWNIKSIGSIVGIAAAILGGMFMSVWIILSRKSQLSSKPHLTMVFGWALFTPLWLLLLQPLSRLLIHEQNIVRLTASFPPHYWLYLVVFALVGAIFAQLFFFKGVEKVPASVAGIILLLEPVSASLLAAILFSQQIGWNIMAGGSLILLSNYLILRKAN